MTISPRRYDGNDGVIAEDPQSIRYPSGNIVTAVGTPAVPITVDISGVTVDGDGVAAKAGVVFLDAQGSLRRSRVTDIVTSESPGAYDHAGRLPLHVPRLRRRAGDRGAAAPVGAGPRTLAIANTRIDEYNRVGVLIDGGPDAASPVTPSGLDLRGVISTSQIVGRKLCWDANVDGDCGGPTPARQPRPEADRRRPAVRPGRHPPRGRRPRQRQRARSSPRTSSRARTRPCATARRTTRTCARGPASGSSAPTPPNSSVTRTNIVDNAYGVLNAAADNTADAANPLKAENNWWGLCSPVGTNRCNGEPTGNTQPPNNGPAVSPTTNPPYPENPVNGAADARRLDHRRLPALPRRAAERPGHGPVPGRPGADPGLRRGAGGHACSPERAEYRRGETVMLTRRRATTSASAR